MSKIQTSLPVPGGEISSWAENPLFHLRRVSISFLQQLFKHAPRGSFHWDLDSELSEIEITADVPLHPEIVEKRPAIAVVRSGVQWGGVTMDQLMELNMRTGARTHTDLISGNLVFNCLSRVETEAEQIGWLVSRHFWILRRIMLSLGFHDIGQRTNISAPSPPGSIISGDTTTEIANVVVITPFHFQWTERITEQELSLLQSIRVDMNISAPRPIRNTQTLIPEGHGTALYQVDGTRVSHQSIMGNVRSPVDSSQETASIEPTIGGSPADPPQTITVLINED